METDLCGPEKKLTSTCPLGTAAKPGMTTFSTNTDRDGALNMTGGEGRFTRKYQHTGYEEMQVWRGRLK